MAQTSTAAASSSPLSESTVLTRELARGVVALVYKTIEEQAAHLVYPCKKREMDLVIDHLDTIIANELRSIMPRVAVDRAWNLVQRKAGVRHLMSLQTLVEHRVRAARVS
jgi:hypothetical protein